MKRHKKRARLKTAAVVKDSIGASVQDALATCCRGTSFIAVAVALSVAGIIATALAPTALATLQAGVSNIIPLHSESECGSGSGDGLGFGCSDRLGTDDVDRSGYNSCEKVGWGYGSARYEVSGFVAV